MQSNITLREITSQNLKSVLDLEVADSQKQHYPRSNAYSIAEGHYPPDDDPVWMRAIYASNIPVGFLMTSEAPEQGEYYLWRIMIAAQFQANGYAAQALRLLVERIRAIPNSKSLITSHLQGNHHAGHVFRSQGFANTGETLGMADVVMRMEL